MHRTAWYLTEKRQIKTNKDLHTFVILRNATDALVSHRGYIILFAHFIIGFIIGIAIVFDL